MGEPVALGSLSPKELMEVRESLQQELQTMTQNAVTLQSTAAKFGAAGQAVEYLQEQKQGEMRGGRSRGLPKPTKRFSACAWLRWPPPVNRHPAGQPVLLPLTESLYVSGALESVESVILEVGTGYFVEVRLC